VLILEDVRERLEMHLVGLMTSCCDSLISFWVLFK
jgi:hypothetical protein